MRKAWLALLAFALSGGIAKAQTTYINPWQPVNGSTVSLAVSNTSSSVALGATFNVQSATTVKVCNTGTVAAFIVLGSGTPTAKTTNDIVPGGLCMGFALPATATSLAAITSASTTTLQISVGSGGSASISGTVATGGLATLTGVPVVGDIAIMTATGVQDGGVAPITSCTAESVVGNNTNASAAPACNTTLTLGDGSAGTPTYSFFSDATSGISKVVSSTFSAIVGGRELVRFDAVGAGGDYLDFTANNTPTIIAHASSVISFQLSGTGNGGVDLMHNGANNYIARFSGVGSSVDYFQFTNAATANPATITIAASGSDSNVNIAINPLGSGVALFGAGMRNAHLITGTNADVVCLDSSGNFLIQAAASCTISSLRFKNLVGDGQYRDDPLKTVMALNPVVYTMKPGEQPNPDVNYGRVRINLSAENVASVEPRCAIYEQDGKTPKAYDNECVLALIVSALKQQQQEIAHLR